MKIQTKPLPPFREKVVLWKLDLGSNDLPDTLARGFCLLENIYSTPTLHTCKAGYEIELCFFEARRHETECILVISTYSESLTWLPEIKRVSISLSQETKIIQLLRFVEPVLVSQLIFYILPVPISLLGSFYFLSKQARLQPSFFQWRRRGTSVVAASQESKLESQIHPPLLWVVGFRYSKKNQEGW